MSTKTKNPKFYETPEIKIFEIESQDLLSMSKGEDDFDPNEWDTEL